MVRIANTIKRLFERKNVCENVSDETFEENLYKHSLLFGLDGYKTYSEVCIELKIKPTYLRYIISTNIDEIGEPFHHKRLSNNKLLSLKQISIIRCIVSK